MTPMLFQSRVRTHFITAPDLPFNYVLNPKAGCTTVAEHLWRILDKQRGTKTFKGDPHASGPWLRINECPVDTIDEVVAKPTISMVRNPYARALSGYLSKVGERKEDTFVWAQFCERFRIATDAVPTFAEYLSLIERERPEMMDRHWAPQYQNLLQPTARIDRIFYLEDFMYLQAYVGTYFKERMKRSLRGFRDARTRLDGFYTPEIIEQVQRIYAVDFKTFGYSTDIKAQRPHAPIDSFGGLPEGLAPFLKYMAAKEWQEKLVHLDHFEQLHGKDYSTAMARFSVGGPNGARNAAANYVLKVSPPNWMILREIAAIYGRRKMPARQAEFNATAEMVHRALLTPVRPGPPPRIVAPKPKAKPKAEAPAAPIAEPKSVRKKKAAAAAA